MFEDREDAGKNLALKLKRIIKGKDYIVVALLRGGIVLGKKISDYFQIPLYPLVIRKIGSPDNPELAIGAIGPKKTIYWDEKFIKYLSVNNDYKSIIIEEKSKEVEGLEKIFKTQSASRQIKNKKVILVDDGVATGASAICASIFLKKEKTKEIILAAPIVTKDILRDINKYFDRVIALKVVENLGSVGEFYRCFPQVSNEEALSRML